MQRDKRGFTLIELLIVIALIAILAGAVIIALNPARQFSRARNSQRRTHLNSIMNAFQQNATENSGTFTCAAGAVPTTAAAMSPTGYNICGCLVPTYISSMPFDPSGGSYTDCTTYSSGYNIQRDAATSRITISAPSAELGESISVVQ